MSEQKGLGSKLLGIFVESGESRRDADEKPELGKTPADVMAELANAGMPPRAHTSPGAPAADTAPLPGLRPATMTGGPVDFDGVFRDAGMDAAELDRVKKAEELLRSLPESTPHPVKKQIVEASLKAFGFEVEKIVQAAQNQKRALDAYVKVNENATAKAIQDAEAQIRALNDKVTALRADIEKRTGALATLTTSAQGRKGQVQKVVDFFQPPAGPPAGGAS